MALLVFPANPVNGQLYPTNPVAGQYQYQWSSADQTWRLLGAATGVTPGTYCPSTTSAPHITVDALGRISYVECVELDYVKLNNSNAYNNYIWPNADGNPADVLTTDGSGGLFWMPQTGGGGGGGGVTFVGAGIGLSTVSGLPITTTGTINLDPATTTDLGGVIPDGTTITVDAAGVISAVLSTPGFGLVLESGAYKTSVPALNLPPAISVAPADATDGSLYYDTDLGIMFYRYNDGVTSQWVQVSP